MKTPSLLKALKLDGLSAAKLLKLHAELSEKLGLQASGARKTRGPNRESAEAVEAVVSAFAKHPKKSQLIKAGKSKDQLLRSLVPLYVARGLKTPVNSGLISRFWGKQGVRYAAPNAAKALRKHPGYTKAGKNGPQITAHGIKYVENALGK
jgi:hypothetical protein